jgi:hypothetical protein
MKIFKRDDKYQTRLFLDALDEPVILDANIIELRKG